MFRAGDEIKVFVQLKEGTLHELTGMVRDVTIMMTSHPVYAMGQKLPIKSVPEGTEMSLHIVGGDLITTLSDNVPKAIKSRRSSSEWMCDYCSSVNVRLDTHCKTCAASRSFIYD